MRNGAADDRFRWCEHAPEWRFGAAEQRNEHTVELWGGHECTVNRVGDRFFDQTLRTGHHDRPGDLAEFAALGISALRYPALWERIAPEKPGLLDFTWIDQRLRSLQTLAIRPILGLLHHGSGPTYTSLLDPDFPRLFADYGAVVARRYPWVRDWTPINEPLTTARFSALYGHWYPHCRDDRAFLLALFHELEATRAGMKAIRAVRSDARLIQTDDLGVTLGTPSTQNQVAFDNARRWLSWDLLCGRVARDHALWEYLDHFGFGDRALGFAADPCPPDVIGINYYATSERFLDDRLDRYPPETHGSNGRIAYADVEAVRVAEIGLTGPEPLLREAWSRYGIPIAVTEAHLACSREEQMRWFNGIWRTGERLNAEGVPIEAVTAWSLLGAFDWNSLVTRDTGHYEPGVFDLRGGRPRPTAMARLLRELATGLATASPVLDQPGWWQRDIRIAYPGSHVAARATVPRSNCRPVLITGATGTLGKAFAMACTHRGIPFVLTTRTELRIEEERSVEDALARYHPWAVINTAGWVRVDDAEDQPEACLRANVHGVRVLARAAAERVVPFVTFSSDLVFDGRAGRAYVEEDRTGPLNVYGRSKAEAEMTLNGIERALVVRTAAFFSAHDAYNFAAAAISAAMRGDAFAAADDLVVSPTYVPDLVDATLDLLIDGETGLWHLTNSGAVSWADFARLVLDRLGLDTRLIENRPWRSFGWAAERPASSALDSTRGRLLPPLENAIDRFVTLLRATAVGRSA